MRDPFIQLFIFSLVVEVVAFLGGLAIGYIMAMRKNSEVEQHQDVPEKLSSKISNSYSKNHD